jgi:hypothetical protein
VQHLMAAGCALLCTVHHHAMRGTDSYACTHTPTTDCSASCPTHTCHREPTNATVVAKSTSLALLLLLSTSDLEASVCQRPEASGVSKQDCNQQGTKPPTRSAARAAKGNSSFIFSCVINKCLCVLPVCFLCQSWLSGVVHSHLEHCALRGLRGHTPMGVCAKRPWYGGGVGHCTPFRACCVAWCKLQVQRECRPMGIVPSPALTAVMPS